MKLTIKFLSLFFAALLMSCIGGSKISGSGPVVPDTRMLTSINEIVLDAPIRVELFSAEEQTIIVHAQSNVQPVLKTTVKGETLTISTEGNVSMDGDTYISIALPALKSIKNSTSANVSGKSFSGDKLKLEANASGDIALSELSYDDYEVTAKGSGSLTVAGRGKKLDGETSSSGDINASDLTVDKAKVTTKGSGNIMVAVGGELKAKITGSGNVTYSGSPKIELDKTGSGELKGN